jgi:hypothetical protein
MCKGLADAAQKMVVLNQMEVAMKPAVAIIMAALLLLISCANTKNMTPEELEAIRKSNERYERSKGP